MSEPKTTKVYLMVECEVEDAGMVNGCDAASRAARTLNDVIFDGTERRGDSGKIEFNAFGKVSVGHPSILPDHIAKAIRRRSRAMHKLECETDSYAEFKNAMKPHELLLEAVIRDGEKPAIERWNALIARGAINEKGEVLIRGPWNEGDEDE